MTTQQKELTTNEQKILNTLLSADSIKLEDDHDTITGLIPDHDYLEGETQHMHSFKLCRRLSGFSVKIELVVNDYLFHQWASYDSESFARGIEVFETVSNKAFNNRSNKISNIRKSTSALFGI